MAENKAVKNTIETNDVKDIDINVIIERTVNKVQTELENKYKSIIDSYENKIDQLEKTIKDKDSQKLSAKENKRISLMWMGWGCAGFNRGRVNIYFENLFDTKLVKREVFEEMYDYFGEYFRNFEIIILDKEIREEFGLEYNFATNGADKDTFYKMLKITDNDLITKLNNFSYPVSMSFLTFFVNEYINRNFDAISKYSTVLGYYQGHYGMHELQNQIQDVIANGKK